METTQAGPLDIVLLRFPTTQFNGQIGPALRDLVVSNTVRVIDVLFVYRDLDGSIGSIELADLNKELEPAFIDLHGQLGGGLLDAEDVDEIGAGLDPGSSVVVLVFENLWAVPFINAVRSVGGELIDQARVPADLVAAARLGLRSDT
jgi:hypothetical protein